MMLVPSHFAPIRLTNQGVKRNVFKTLIGARTLARSQSKILNSTRNTSVHI